MLRIAEAGVAAISREPQLDGVDVRRREPRVELDRPIERREDGVVVDAEAWAVAEVEIRVAESEPDFGVARKAVARRLESSEQSTNRREIARVRLEGGQRRAQRV